MRGPKSSRQESGSGAFRHVLGGSNPIVPNSKSYGQCDRCGLIFEDTKALRGLPNYKDAEAARRGWEARNRKDALDKRLAPLFKKPSNRCTCDPEGDARYLQQTGLTHEVRAPQSGDQRVNSSTDGLSEQLEKLTALFNSGALSKEQFEAAKNALLGL